MSNRARTTLSFFISIVLICCTIVAIGYFKKSEEDYSNYSITLDAIGTILDNTTITPNADGTISLPTPTKEGYTFDGWYVDGTKWVQDMVITEDMTLTARWTPVKYNITFVVNNVSTIVQVDHNTIPEYIGELEKPNTAYYTYSFSNWLPAIEPATKDMTYTAVFNAVKTTYDITLSSNIHSAGNLVGAGCYEYQSNITISATTNNGYLFDGWYYEGFLYTTDNSFTLNSISENFAFEARYSTIDYSITYHSIYNIPHSNITSYTVLDSDFTLQGLDKYGYTFMGWYTEDGGAGNKITTIDCSLAREYDLYAYFVITNYTITYNLNDGTVSGSNIQSYNIDTATFTLINPTKPGYDFIGWTGTDITTPTMTVTITEGSIGNREYTAHYSAFDSYTVILNIEYPNAGTLTGDGVYREGTDVTISATENTGYEFIGWYNNSTLYSNDSTITISNIDNSINLIAKYNLTNYNISYLNDDGCVNTNTTSFTVLDGTITLNNISKTGYTFHGWYTGSNGTGSKVTTISSNTARNHTVYAHFTTILYTLTYHLDGGNVSGTNPANYTIETNTFTLINPTKDAHEFIGWTGTGITTMTTTVTVSIGSTGNKTFTANWRLLSTTITFKTGDATLDDITITAKPGTTISAPTVVASNYNMTGYTLDGWYSDTALTTKYTFDKMPESNITLYGSWDYFIDEGFYPYLEEFSKASTTTTTIINSFDELVAFVEYISFNYITRAYPFKIAYTTPSNTIVSNAINESTYPTNCTISYTTTYVYLGSNNKDSEGTLTADPSKSHITAEQNYSMLTTLDSNRAANNTDFNINTVNKILSVYSTNQLMYALEKGLRPVCEPNSPAERIYSKAKTILNEICDDNMTDFEKIKAIYDWLILNVQYDHYAVANYTNSWKNYDAWFAEGVFDKGVAVCDGISKALLILAKIENIPAVRTTSTNHAWNKVYINGNWYGIDATHGDISMGDTGMNYLTYNNFLFTDSFKLSQSQNDTQYDELVANSVYDYYENADYTYNGTTFDLEINSQTEFNTLLKYLKSFTPTTTNYSFEFTLASGFAPTINTLITNGVSQSGFTYTNISYAQLDYSTGQTVYLIIVTP